jgi:hypothetical protein
VSGGLGQRVSVTASLSYTSASLRVHCCAIWFRIEILEAGYWHPVAAPVCCSFLLTEVPPDYV